MAVNILKGGEMEAYLTVEEAAVYLKFTEQTIRRWVLNREIPFCKVKNSIRFRISEIDKWVDNGGIPAATAGSEAAGDDLFSETGGNV
jgi:excisionase family DNA binding protein